MHWRNERSEYGWTTKEKVQMYQCEFTTTKSHPKNEKTYTAKMSVLVICDKVEDAIAICRKQWPTDFVLHQVVKRNQRCDLIVDDNVLGLAEST